MSRRKRDELLQFRPPTHTFLAMRPSDPRLIRLIRRKDFQGFVIPPPAPQTLEMRKPSLINLLMEQRAKAGESWPVNIRLEPVVKKEALKHVQADVRVRLKRLLKER